MENEIAVAIEFGFKGHEKGWNLEKTMIEANKVIKLELRKRNINE